MFVYKLRVHTAKTILYLYSFSDKKNFFICPFSLREIKSFWFSFEEEHLILLANCSNYFDGSSRAQHRDWRQICNLFICHPTWMTSKCFFLVALNFVWIFFFFFKRPTSQTNRLKSRLLPSGNTNVLKDSFWLYKNPAPFTCNFAETSCFRGLDF